MCFSLTLITSDLPSASSQITQFYRGSKRNPKPRIEGLSECGLDSVQEGHCVRDAVEGQSSCSVIQVHSYSGGAGNRDFSAHSIVLESVTSGSAAQTPGLLITSQTTVITPPFPADLFI
uniref:Uncharacterized protein n=1 Tax=Anguilla anguilla TaxID=7936 RepID=A0A0E9Y1P3_ANGAN